MRKAVRTCTCAAIVAVAAVVPAGARAAPGTVTDGDFAGGTTAGTEVVGGVLQLRRGVTDAFDAPFLPLGLSAAQWTAGGSAVVAGGVLTVDGARVVDDALGPAPRTLAFRAAFGGGPFEHIGFGVTFADGPWAMFSTRTGGSTTTLYARTATGGLATSVDQPIAIGNVQDEHDYRIEWKPAGVDFFVDGVLKASPALAIGTPLRPVISDLDPGGANIRVRSMVRDRYPASGTFASRVLDAGDVRAAWQSLSAIGATDGVAFATRSGGSPAPDGSWSAWTGVGTGGAIASPPARYLQYSATLAPAAPLASPSVDGVAVAFDDPAPRAAVDGIDVAGTSANVRFSSPDPDAVGFRCGLDGAAVAPCSSPKAFTGLAAGAHSVAVQAVDRAGSAGAPVSGTFTIAGRVALRLFHRLVRANRRGIIKLRVGCTTGAGTCTIKLRLRRGRRVVGRKTVRMPAGDSRIITLRLPKGARRALARRGKLKLKATFSARDGAGHKKTLKRTVTVMKPR